MRLLSAVVLFLGAVKSEGEEAPVRVKRQFGGNFDLSSYDPNNPFGTSPNSGRPQGNRPQGNRHQTWVRRPDGTYGPAEHGSGGSQPGCQGPWCQGGQTTEGPTDQKVVEAFQSISWLSRHAGGNNSLALPNLPSTSANEANSRFFLAVNEPDVPFQQCRTPRFEAGHCRYLQHCILHDFIFSFDRFLQYVCFIEGVYVGVCCPDHRYPGSTGGSPTPAPTRPTAAPTRPTAAPTRPTPRPTRPPPRPTPNREGCGQNARSNTRIVGGVAADAQEWPWMVAIIASGRRQFCGGTLISNRHVLTAAHCTERLPVSQLVVRVGQYNFDQASDVTTDFKAKSVQQHPDYENVKFHNDIAIITLPSNVQFNDDVWPICLPPAGPLFVDDTAVVTGWGKIYHGGPPSTKLQEVTVPVWTNAECLETYKPRSVIDKMLCAGGREGGLDSCEGDSGGPLQNLGPNGRWRIIGIVSWGIRCAEAQFPGVYTRVNKYLPWIEQNMI